MKKQSIHRNFIFIIAVIMILISVSALQAQNMDTMVSNYVIRLGVDPHISILHQKNSTYSDKVTKAGFGDNALVAFGKIGNDTYEFDGHKLVGSPIEYYYTDLVFLRKDYEKALVGLYRNLAEKPDKQAEVRESIVLVKEVASRRGVVVNETAAKARYRKEITADILTAGSKYFDRDKSKKYCEPIVDYYLNPTNSNYNKVVEKARELSRSRESITAYFSTISALSTTLRTRVSLSL